MVLKDDNKRNIVHTSICLRFNCIYISSASMHNCGFKSLECWVFNNEKKCTDKFIVQLYVINCKKTGLVKDWFPTQTKFWFWISNNPGQSYGTCLSPEDLYTDIILNKYVPNHHRWSSVVHNGTGLV